MKILVTGATGQVARSLLERAPRHGVEILTVGRPELDLLEEASVIAALQRVRADVIVNAAAATAVDRLESDPALAHRVNAEGAGAVARAAAALGAAVVQLSTDYVFDGALARPYMEDDATAPLNVYGLSKLAGEAAVGAANPRHVILRTSWVYSPYGNNFVAAMLRLSRGGGRVRVVADQVGAPTSAHDLADAIIAVCQRLAAPGAGAEHYGVFHATAAGETSWAGFAALIFESAVSLGRAQAQVTPITTADYPPPARRPRNSRLACDRLRRVYGLMLPDWRAAARACVARMIEEGSA